MPERESISFKLDLRFGKERAGIKQARQDIERFDIGHTATEIEILSRKAAVNPQELVDFMKYYSRLFELLWKKKYIGIAKLEDTLYTTYLYKAFVPAGITGQDPSAIKRLPILVPAEFKLLTNKMQEVHSEHGDFEFEPSKNRSKGSDNIHIGHIRSWKQAELVKQRYEGPKSLSRADPLVIETYMDKPFSEDQSTLFGEVVPPPLPRTPFGFGKKWPEDYQSAG